MATPASNATSQGSDDQHLVIFDQVRAILRFHNLPALALRLRNQDVAPADTASSIHGCQILSEPLFGAHHILFTIEFNDGVRWLLKVPANGYLGAFDAMSARALRSEVMTMRLIKKETTVPVPEVYHFDHTLHNELGCPFILMEYVDGRSLYDVWFDQTAGPEVLERRRCRALEGVAQAVMQLNKFVFSRAGEILFDESGNPCDVGPQRMVDMSAMLDCLRENDDYDGSYIFCTVGPFSDAKSWFICMLDRREPPKHEFGAGVLEALRLFIDLVFPDSGHLPETEDDAQFVLSHPDLDIQNVIVSDDGSLLSLIDWDGVGTVPRCLGNEAYPTWLTRDWDKAKYAFDENAAPGPDCPNYRENSPSELEHYREVYQKIIEKISEFPSTAKKVTSQSLLLQNLYIAVVDPVCTTCIVERVFEEIKARTATTESSTGSDSEHHGTGVVGEGSSDCDVGRIDASGQEEADDFSLHTVCTGLQRGDLSDQHLQRLKSGFQALLL
ncbi:hypothetical protein VTO42DRAFT_5916 [Malbranchea cinnamomea]